MTKKREPIRGRGDAKKDDQKRKAPPEPVKSDKDEGIVERSHLIERFISNRERGD